jgi:N-acetyl-anhydromuramyl-L-alanine amidase AmpD
VVGYARPINRTGAHCRGRNKGTIGISLVGGRGSTADDAFSDNFTSEQADALRNLIEQYKKQFPSIVKVTGHNDYASKACPGFSVEDWYNG